MGELAVGEYDKWVRKLVAVLLELGFEDVSSKGGKHRKFRYDGELIDIPYTATVPSHVKSSSRRAFLGGLRRSLKECGANPELIQRFDNFTLQMLAVDPSDSIEEIEEKLYDALNSNDKLAVAELSLALAAAKLGASDKIDSSAVSRYSVEVRDRAAYLDLTREINGILEDQLKRAFDHHIEEFGSFSVDIRLFHSGKRFSEFSTETVQRYGFEIVGCLLDDIQPFELYGNCTGFIASVLQKYGAGTRFDLLLDNDNGEMNNVYWDSNSVYGFQLDFEYGKQTISDLQQIYTELSGQFMLLDMGMSRE